MKPFNQLIAELEVARSLLHERIKNGLSKKVAKFYDDMIADLQAQILKKKNVTNNLAQTISDLKQSLKTPDLRKDFLMLAQNEQDHLLDYNELAGFNLFSSVLPESSIERLVDSAQLDGATVKAWNNGLNADQKKRLERELKIGVSLGETTPMLAQRIAQALQKSKRDATSIALTGAGAVVSEIRQAFFEANDDVIKCYKYQATLDTRTSELCRAYDGLMWDKDYKPIGHDFPFRKPRVNTHFNCRSVIIPVTKSWDELGVEGMDGASDRTRSSMNGYVPQDMTFNDWLKTQSPETIEKTLGKGRAELFLQGKITMRDLITQQGRSVNLSDLSSLSARTRASNKLKAMFADVDFTKAGYRPPLKEPLTLATLSPRTISKLKAQGIETDGKLKVATQRELLHGIRLKKIKDGNALSAEQFFDMPLNLTEDNLYYGKDEMGNDTINFFWESDNELCYAYFTDKGILQTYGKTKVQTIKRYKAIKGS